MKKLVPLILLSILIITPIFFFEDTDSRYEKLSKSILCPVCQGETLFDSPSEYAEDMRIILREQIDNGLSDKQIMDYWTSRFGDRINTNPQNENLILIIFQLFLNLSFFVEVHNKFKLS